MKPLSGPNSSGLKRRAPLGFTRDTAPRNDVEVEKHQRDVKEKVDFQSELQIIKSEYERICAQQNSIENTLKIVEENFKALELKVVSGLTFFRAKLAEYDERLKKEAEDLAKKEDEIVEAIQQEKAKMSQQILADALKKKEILERKTKERLAEQNLLDLKRRELEEEEKALQEENDQIMAQLAKRREAK